MPSPEKIERILANPFTRAVLGILTRKNSHNSCLLYDVFNTYGTENIPRWKRIKHSIPFLIIEYIRKKLNVDVATVRDRVLRHPSRSRALVNTMRGISQYGLQKPQTFSAPLMVVWNFTQACNFNCIHCYQNAKTALPDELNLKEKLNVLDILADNDVPLLALSGGEPMMGAHFLEVLEYAGKKRFNISLATNGSLLTESSVKEMRSLGLDYAEISLDSIDSEKHDAFRGRAGYWQKAVTGIEKAVAFGGGMGVGVAATITRLNFDELDKLIDFAIELGATTFYAFNFVPTGRAKDIIDLDLTPQMREEMLQILQCRLNEGKISVMSSSAQFGRACIQYAKTDDMINTGHYGAGPGGVTKTLAKYIGGCGAGRCYMSIQPNGDITPCVFMPLAVGSVRRDDIMNIWRKGPVFQLLRDRNDRTGHCLVCQYKYHCGGCRARSWGYFDDLKAPDPGCIHNLDAWEELIAGKEHETEKTPSVTSSQKNK